MSALREGTLTGASVLITGSTGGIGCAIAALCVEEGAIVFAAGRDEQKLSSLNDKLGDALIPLCYDITDESAVKNTFRDIQKRVSDGATPPLYGLVNCAGALYESPISVTNMDNLKSQLNINFLAPYQHMQLASRLMSRLRRGSIVNLVSQIGEQGSAGMSAYASSKAALTGATLSLAKELAPIGIRVNAVAPGFIDTKMTQHYQDAAKEAVLNRIIAGRPGQPEEVANAVLFLLSGQGSYTTGHILPVDGHFCP